MNKDKFVGLSTVKVIVKPLFILFSPYLHKHQVRYWRQKGASKQVGLDRRLQVGKVNGLINQHQ